jgi:hypothetical protein
MPKARGFNGSFVASPTSTEIEGSFWRAEVSALLAMSTSTTRYPARATGMPWRPVPPAMSTTGSSLGKEVTVSTIQAEGGLSGRAPDA